MGGRTTGIALVVVQSALIAAVIRLPWTDSLWQRELYVLPSRVLTLVVLLISKARWAERLLVECCTDYALRAPRRLFHPRNRAHRLTAGVSRATQVEPSEGTKESPQ
jgi:hypothetical protein